GEPKFVLIGDLNINRTDDDARPQLFNVKEKIYHPNYRPPSSYNDIALIKLDKPAILNTYVRPACLYTDPEIRTTKALATGWGKIGFTKATSPDLLKVALEIFTYDRCRQAYKNLQLKLPNGIQERSQVCWGSQTEEKDTCRGDSGGPLQIGSKNIYCMYEIIGITSLGKACGFVNIPAIYTRVSYFVGWIESVVWGT
ncbi:serine protease snake-like, partial [Agrilus planipennis]